MINEFVYIGLLSGAAFSAFSSATFYHYNQKSRSNAVRTCGAEIK